MRSRTLVVLGLVAGVPENWSVAVVPDSATEQLAGLSGTMKINIEGGKHYYELDYALPEG